MMFKLTAFATSSACSCQRRFDAGAFALDIVVLKLFGWMLGGEVGVFVFEFLVAALFALCFFAFEALFTELVLFTCGMRSLTCPVWIGGHWHLDAVYGAWRYAQLAAGALVGDDGVHEFGCADDGVNGAGLDAFGAADAFVFDDVGNA